LSILPRDAAGPDAETDDDRRIDRKSVV